MAAPAAATLTVDGQETTLAANAEVETLALERPLDGPARLRVELPHAEPVAPGCRVELSIPVAGTPLPVFAGRLVRVDRVHDRDTGTRTALVAYDPLHEAHRFDRRRVLPDIDDVALLQLWSGQVGLSLDARVSGVRRPAVVQHRTDGTSLAALCEARGWSFFADLDRLVVFPVGAAREAFDLPTRPALRRLDLELNRRPARSEVRVRAWDGLRGQPLSAGAAGGGSALGEASWWEGTFPAFGFGEVSARAAGIGRRAALCQLSGRALIALAPFIRPGDHLRVDPEVAAWGSVRVAGVEHRLGGGRPGLTLLRLDGEVAA